MTFRGVVAVALVSALTASPPALPLSASARDGAGPRSHAQGEFEAREEAYRASNLGVALLEQFKHAEGAEQFRRALRLAPDLALAKINLAVALFNVPDLPAAERAAREAAEAAPRAPQPRYLLGLIARQQNRTEEAVAEFRRVAEIDPRDVGTNVNLGQLYAQQRDYAEAVARFRAAVEAEPYNGTALYNLGTALLRAGEREEGQRLIQKFQELRQSGAATTVGNNYLEQGRYAEAVTSTGAEPELVERATPPVAFVDATAQALPAASRGVTVRGARVRGAGGATPPVFGRRLTSAEARATRTKAELAASLGGGVTLFDADDDGDLDLFDAAPARARLYRNDRGRFVDITARSGAFALPARGTNVGAVAGDYDNDGLSDLFVLRHGASGLYRNLGGGRFRDATREAGLAPYPHLPSAAAFADVDHDGDLDIFVAGLVSLEGARAASSSVVFPEDFAPAPNLLLRNDGAGKFADVTRAAGLEGRGERAVAVVPTDYDNRRDLDLLVINHKAAPALYRNLRDGTFRNVASDAGLAAAPLPFTSAAAGDVNKDEFTDFFFAAQSDEASDNASGGSRGGAGVFAVSDGKGRFALSTPQGAGAEPLGAAQVLDYDNDGLPDLVTVSASGLRVLRNVGGAWAFVGEAAPAPLPSSLHPRVLASGDADGDGDTDIFVRAASGALRFLRNDGGNANASVRVRLAGRVSNRAGIGAKIEARAGSLGQKLETYAATPAPAPADVLFGLGRRARADAVRVLWPSGVVQAETEIPAAATAAPSTPPTQGARRAFVTLPVRELDRKPSSCPYLYAWNGARFEFVTDFLGGGELGYWQAPGVRAAPDPDEYVRIRADQLKERDGRFELRVTNELEEALFIDRLQLVSVAHPASVEVFPNEGLGNPTSARFTLHAARDARPPRAATDDHGRDVLARVSKLDRAYPDDFKLLPLRGYAEEHALVLDLGEEEAGTPNAERGTTNGKESPRARPSSFVAPRSASSVAPRSASSSILLLTGWTDYAFSSDNVAASHSGLALAPPKLQVRDARGRWQTVVENIGIPVGRPQTVLVDLSGKFLSASREVRVVTNMRIYWDQILVAARADDEGRPRVERLEASSADLRWRGFSAEAGGDGREPRLYDYEKVSFQSPWKIFPGRYTRLGDVRALLAETDDIFVVSRPGDEVAVSFDASALAPLPAGWTRTFLLYAGGYSKEMDINSASPDAVAPLPFRAMSEYPYRAPESYPATEAHRRYVEQFNTRLVVSPLPKLAGLK